MMKQITYFNILLVTHYLHILYKHKYTKYIIFNNINIININSWLTLYFS